MEKIFDGTQRTNFAINFKKQIKEVKRKVTTNLDNISGMLVRVPGWS